MHVLEKSIIDSEDVVQGADWSDFSAKACTFLLQPGFQGVLADGVVLPSTRGHAPTIHTINTSSPSSYLILDHKESQHLEVE